MRGVWVFVMGAVLVAGPTSAQSLGEIAKKEKKRREQITSAASSVITEETLSEDPAAATSEPAEASDETDLGEGEGPPRRPSIPDDYLSSTGKLESSEPADEWAEIFAEYQQAYKEAKLYVQFAETTEKHCEDGTPPPPMPPIEGGGLWMIDCGSFEDAGKKARQAVKDIENACMNHARRLRVLPGRARLR